MEEKIIIAGGVIALIIGVVFLQNPGEVKGEMDVYMVADCQCCDVYANIMDRDYDVEKKILDQAEYTQLKIDWGVPQDLASCHTTIIDDYLVEGHIPMEAIEELREDGRDIEGIGMAGMPAGSPGMGGAKTESFRIYEIPEENEKGDLFMEI